MALQIFVAYYYYFLQPFENIQLILSLGAKQKHVATGCSLLTLALEERDYISFFHSIEWLWEAQ